jgi:flagellar hook-associated protein 3 FlgL
VKISSVQMFKNASSQLTEKSSQIAQIQAKIGKGDQLLAPSERPERAALIQRLESSQSQLKSFQGNLSALDARLSIEETVLTSANDLVSRMRELSVASASDTYSAADRRTIAIEVRGLKNELLAIANSQDASGNYLFAGAKVTTRPFEVNTSGVVEYNGDSAQVQISSGSGSSIRMNRPGLEVFQTIADNGDEFGFFDVVDEFIYALEDKQINRSMSSIYNNKDTSINGGSAFNLNIQVESEPPTTHTINVTTDTPEGVADAIEQSGLDFTATLVYQGEGKGVKILIEDSTLAQPKFSIETDAALGFKLIDPLQASLSRVSTITENSSDTLVSIGVTRSLVSSQREANEETQLTIAKLLSQEKDLDYATAVADLSAEIVALEALQSSFAKISQLTLFDYVR